MGILLLAVGGLVLLGGGVASLTRPGLAALGYAHYVLEFYIGVVSLVALSIAVMLGVAATDRTVLMIRHRVLLQAFHRSMAVTSVVALGIHVLLKILEAHASVIDAFVPFFNPGRTVYIGLGTIASYFMLIVTWTGVIRGRFAGAKHPGMWRALHATAYMAWPFALLHGLLAGRPAKTWVIVSYILCLLLVFIGLLIRGAMYWGRRVKAPKATTTGAIKPVGKLAPLPPVTAPPAAALESVQMERSAPRRQIADRPRPPRRALPAAYQEAPYQEDRWADDYPVEAPREQPPPPRRRALDESRIISAAPPSGPVSPRASVSGGQRRPRNAQQNPATQTGRIPTPPRRARHSIDDGYPPEDEFAEGRRPAGSRGGYGRDAFPREDHGRDGYGRSYPRDGYGRDERARDDYARDDYVAGGYEAPPAYNAPAYQAAPAYQPEVGYDDEPSRARGSRRRAPVPEPDEDYFAEAPPRRRRRSMDEFAVREQPAGRGRSRRAAEEISDEEFWAHMRGEALR
ncbi:MAG: hypothetical protein J2P15_03910 [Micromonosporaceae bacterium]|nr:hypothetical protein [Micromonosporaceae bacterium]